MPSVPRIVRGQQVEETKTARAREMRRDMTPEESLLWEKLRRSQLNGYHFRRQQVIHRFIADFYCHAAAFVVELDGESHERRGGYDADRDQVLAGHGFLIVRFENSAVRERLDSVLNQIAEFCDRRIAKS
jgi:very-short-patch-repair endonuclease